MLWPLLPSSNLKRARYQKTIILYLSSAITASFLSFQTNITIFTTIICENVYPVCTVLGFEPMTFSSITTRPGLLPKIKTIIPKFGNLTASRSSNDIVITCALDNKKSVLITYLISKPKRTYLLCFDRYDR